MHNGGWTVHNVLWDSFIYVAVEITQMDEVNKISCPDCNEHMFATNSGNTTTAAYIISRHIKVEHLKDECDTCNAKQPVIESKALRKEV